MRFVSGGLDRVQSRAAFLDLARRSDVPILVIYGDQTPPKSRAEMEALAELPHVQVERLANGKLSIHEEFPDVVTSTIMPVPKRMICEVMPSAKSLSLRAELWAAEAAS